jgi:phosphatidylserine decarboxylase
MFLNKIGGICLLQSLYRIMIELTNHAIPSKMISLFTKSRLSAWLIPSYAKVYRINQEEMEKSLHQYKTLQQLFIRKLKADARPIDESSNSIISPVDAVIEDIGIIDDRQEIVVKGKRYSISEMLGSAAIAEKYLNGLFIILYLSPSHYHRIHSPISGVVTRQWSLGGKSYPVNRLGLKYGKQPLSKNYRMITEVNANGKHVAIVKVGAMFVNSIELTHPNEYLTKGQEMAYFSFGSTVVLLFEKDSVELEAQMTVPMAVKVGERIGFWK